MPADMMGVEITAPKKVKKEKKAKKEASEKRTTKTDRRRVLKEMSSPDVSHPTPSTPKIQQLPFRLVVCRWWWCGHGEGDDTVCQLRGDIRVTG